MTEHLEVRGSQALYRPATGALRAIAALTDATWMALLGLLLLRASGLPPMPHLGLLIGWAGLGALAVAAQRRLLKGTVGQRLWGLRRIHLDGKTRLNQMQLLEGQPLTVAVLATLALGWAAAHGVQSQVLSHPAWIQAEPWGLSGLAASEQAPARWRVTPFFYLMGAWPGAFEGHPVLWSLPYEKGPPQHFVGHIVARWDSPDIRLTLEGPLTPVRELLPETLESCVAGPLAQRLSPRCLHLRTTVLGKHLREMGMEAGPGARWELRWFDVQNPGLPASERPRGLFLSATGRVRTQERFVLIHPKGSTQTLILDRPSEGSRAEAAHQLAVETLRTQRFSGTLEAGRAWVDREIETIRLADLQKEPDTEKRILRLGQVQSTLLSKISVDPRGYDAFFHLGGVSFLLARQAREASNVDWAAAAKPMLQSALRYARDLNAEDSRTNQLQNMAIEAAKL